MTNLAKYVVALEAQTAKYEKQLGRANKSLSKFHKRQTKTLDSVKKGFAVLGIGLAVRRLAGFAQESIAAADRANKFSQQVGIATETVTGLELAAQLAGVQMKEVEVGLRRLGRSMSDANEGLATQKRSFDDLGVKYKTATGELRTVDGVLRSIADRFSIMEDGARKVARAQELFGRSGSQLIPMLNNGAAGIEAVIDQARKLGLVWSKDAAKGAEDFNDRLALLRGQMRGLSNRITQNLLPGLNATTSAFLIFTEATGESSDRISALSIFMTYLAKGFFTIASGMEQLAMRGAALAAWWGAVLGGNFKGASAVIAAFNSDLTESRTRFQATMAALNNTDSADDALTALAAVVSAQQKLNRARAEEAVRKSGVDNFIKNLETRNALLGKSKLESDLYKLAQIGASEADIERARVLLTTIGVYEKEAAALLAVREAAAKKVTNDETARAAFNDVVSSLRTETETINDTYAARLEIIKNNSKAGTDFQIEQLTRLKAVRDEQLGRVSENPEFDAIVRSLRTEEETIRQSYKSRLAVIKSLSGESTDFQIEQIKRLTAERDKQLADLGDNFSEMDARARRAAENMQDAFADFLFDPFADGIEGMLKGFADIIRRMAAEAAAAAIFDKIGGTSGIFKTVLGLFGGGNDATGAIGESFNAGTVTKFGGARAKGGPVSAGRSYLVGEPGPELFTPRGSGQITPLNGGLGTSNTFQIDARGAAAGVETRIEAGVARAVALADFRRVDAKRRGRV